MLIHKSSRTQPDLQAVQQDYKKLKDFCEGKHNLRKYQHNLWNDDAWKTVSANMKKRLKLLYKSKEYKNFVKDLDSS